MLPYHDENATQRTPVVTLLLIGLNAAFWVLVQGAGFGLALPRSVCELGLIPGELTGSLPPGTRFAMGENLVCLTDPGLQISHVFTSMFMHGSWMHLLGNMWFLWLFGNNIEDSTGRGRFLVFYLLCGVAAALAQVVSAPASPIPMVGASGAISGVMGGYLVLYPKVRVFTLVPIGFMLTTVALPAWMMLVYWLLLQVAGGVMSAGSGTGGVAFWAHAGGFVAGLALIKLFASQESLTDHRAHRWQPTRQYRR